MSTKDFDKYQNLKTVGGWSARLLGAGHNRFDPAYLMGGEL